MVVGGEKHLTARLRARARRRVGELLATDPYCYWCRFPLVSPETARALGYDPHSRPAEPVVWHAGGLRREARVATIDHLVPLRSWARGAKRQPDFSPNDPHNVVVACYRCNNGRDRRERLLERLATLLDRARRRKEVG